MIREPRSAGRPSSRLVCESQAKRQFLPPVFGTDVPPTQPTAMGGPGWGVWVRDRGSGTEL